MTSPGTSCVRRQKIAGPVDWASRCPEKTAVAPPPGIGVNRYQAASSGLSGASIWLWASMPLTSMGASMPRRLITRRAGTKGAFARGSGPLEGSAADARGSAEADVRPLTCRRWVHERRFEVASTRAAPKAIRTTREHRPNRTLRRVRLGILIALLARAGPGHVRRAGCPSAWPALVAPGNPPRTNSPPGPHWNTAAQVGPGPPFTGLPGSHAAGTNITPF